MKSIMLYNTFGKYSSRCMRSNNYLGRMIEKLRVPTVPEKQVARWVDQKLRSASLSGAFKP